METACTEQQQRRQISTFVFFDLETTGLNIDNRNKVTELSMVAVDRSSLLDSQRRQKLPRVMNKLLVPINPIRAVPPVVFELTGLDNANLQFQKDFDDDLATLVNAFLCRLRPPVCLVAHNGYKFDYPLIMKELIAVSSQLPQALLCVDSLVAFRACDWSKRTNETTPAKRKITVNEETPAVKRKMLEEGDGSRSSAVPSSVCELFPEKQTSGAGEGVTNGNVTSCHGNDDERTSENASHLEVGNGVQASNGRSSRANMPKIQFKPVSMKLRDIHEFVVGRPPDNAHTAEDDCLSLVRIVQRIAEWFCSWADQNAGPFSSTEITFDVKKSRNLDRGCFLCD